MAVKCINLLAFFSLVIPWREVTIHYLGECLNQPSGVRPQIAEIVHFTHPRFVVSCPVALPFIDIAFPCWVNKPVRVRVRLFDLIGC